MHIQREKIIRTVLWAAVIGWMGLIFWFSAQTAGESSETSRTTAGLLFRLLGIENIDGIFADEKLYAVIDFAVRKSAHFCIFGVLGGLLTAAISKHIPAGLLKCPVTAVLVGILYALTDEIHQYFVPGRACQIRDILIDSAGVILGCAAVWIILKLILRRRKANCKK